MGNFIRKEVLAEGVEVYCGDASEVLSLASIVAQSTITDPPYGLGELSGTISRIRNRNSYLSYEDSEDNLVRKIIPVAMSAISMCGGRGLVTPGSKCCFLWPRPSVIGGFYQPAAVGMCPWGFAAYNPILFYGKDPRGGRGQSSTMTTLISAASTTEHPCAKPLKAMEWMVEKGSLVGETVLDPFMGSGTTGVACVKLGRKFIGIEIEPKYFDIACKRISDALKQPDLFIEQPKPMKQEALFLGEN